MTGMHNGMWGQVRVRPLGLWVVKRVGCGGTGGLTGVARVEIGCIGVDIDLDRVYNVGVAVLWVRLGWRAGSWGRGGC